MRNLIIVLAFALLAFKCIAQELGSKDTIAIYKSFLASYNDGSHANLNVADRTVVFAPDFTSESAASCLKQIDLQAVPGTQTHALDASVFPDGLKARFISPKDIKLRDPGDAIKKGEPAEDAAKEGFAAGVLTLSEVIFNGDHTRAVLSYSFICGSLCGSGGAMLFEKHDGQWGKGELVCAAWVS